MSALQHLSLAQYTAVPRCVFLYLQNRQSQIMIEKQANRIQAFLNQDLPIRSALSTNTGLAF